MQLSIFATTILISLGCVLPYNAYASADPLKEKLAALATRMETNCTSQFAHKRKLLNAPGKAVDAATSIALDAQQQAQCGCVPERIRSVDDAPTMEQLLSDDRKVRLALLQPWLETCSAVGLRASVPQLCALDAKKKPDAVQALQACGCVNDRLQEISDQTLIDEAKQAYQHYQARVADRSLPRRQSMFDKLTAQCQAEAGKQE